MTVSGSVPGGSPDTGYRELHAACPLALDTVAPTPDAFDLVKINAAEAAAMTGIDTTGTEGAVAAVPGAGRRAGCRGASRWAPAERCSRHPAATCCGGRSTSPGPTPWAAATRSWQGSSSPGRGARTGATHLRSRWERRPPTPP